MELIGFVFLVVAAVVLRFITSNPAFIGAAAEKRVQRILSSLPSNEYSVFHDIMIRRPDGNTTQIDHIIISRFGIWVCETKNYHGHIYGKQSEKYWTQRIGRQRHRLYNPIWQNRGHVSALQEFLGYNVPDAIYGVLVFGDRVGLTIQSEEPVIRMRQLKRFITQFRAPKLSLFDMAAVADQIRRNNITDKAERALHVKRVSGKKRARLWQ
ncbi:nuclease-related domain-containing protein [Alicyclobacillus mengziensis]|uniref:NERD domain-containing protein n=1 Tax=Alicyclobacillus mengziensis TaxID=2931921 RepID=A0A9X7VUV3_9BACL|nr:nuclease-related domain-containing protein [Alicyclobacillus mengziensis]QSO45624.1 NERD domain-containing protein [Alicyclobacillus mengziensis]